MEFDFYKLHVCGNDFIFINAIATGVPSRESVLDLTRKICRRRTGVGGNGLLILRRMGDDGRLSLDSFMPNGRPASIYGDALLCVSRYAFDFGLFENQTLELMTQDGMKKIHSIDSRSFRVCIGKPLNVDENRELTEQPDGEYSRRCVIEGHEYVFTPVRLSRLSAVFFLSSDSHTILRDLSRNFSESIHSVSDERYHPVFVTLFSKDELAIHEWYTHEPVDICTSAASAVIASVVNGVFERDAIVHPKHDELYIQWSESTNEVFITGSPQYVFSGTYYHEDE